MRNPSIHIANVLIALLFLSSAPFSAVVCASSSDQANQSSSESSEETSDFEEIQEGVIRSRGRNAQIRAEKGSQVYGNVTCYLKVSSPTRISVLSTVPQFGLAPPYPKTLLRKPIPNPKTFAGRSALS